MPGRGLRRIPLQAEPGDGAVLAEDRREVRDGADAREVREIGGFFADEQLRELERDAASGQQAVRVGAVGALGIDDRRGRRQDRRNAVMVGDQDVDPTLHRDRDLVPAARPAVDGDDDARTGGGRRRRSPRATDRGPRAGGPGRTAAPRRRAGGVRGRGSQARSGRPRRSLRTRPRVRAARGRGRCATGMPRHRAAARDRGGPSPERPRTTRDRRLRPAGPTAAR